MAHENIEREKSPAKTIFYDDTGSGYHLPEHAAAFESAHNGNTPFLCHSRPPLLLADWNPACNSIVTGNSLLFTAGKSIVKGTPTHRRGTIVPLRQEAVFIPSSITGVYGMFLIRIVKGRLRLGRYVYLFLIAFTSFPVRMRPGRDKHTGRRRRLPRKQRD